MVNSNAFKLFYWKYLSLLILYKLSFYFFFYPSSSSLQFTLNVYWVCLTAINPSVNIQYLYTFVGTMKTIERDYFSSKNLICYKISKLYKIRRMHVHTHSYVKVLIKSSSNTFVHYSQLIKTNCCLETERGV